MGGATCGEAGLCMCMNHITTQEQEDEEDGKEHKEVLQDCEGETKRAQKEGRAPVTCALGTTSPPLRPARCVYSTTSCRPRAGSTGMSWFR